MKYEKMEKVAECEMFKKGDQVVYPMHGAGYIEGTQRKTVGGQEKEYYDISILCGNIRLLLPVANNGHIQLREVIDEKKAKEVLAYFRSLEIDVNAPWSKRYKENVERLKTGSPECVAEVVKALMLRDKTVGLSTGDRQVMVMAKNILCSELSLALKTSMEHMQDNLQNVVDDELVG